MFVSRRRHLAHVPLVARWRMLAALLVAALAAGAGCFDAPPNPGVEPERLRVEVLGQMPHDTSAFSQGLELAGGTLYEGTGLVGRSELRELDPVSGEIRRRAALPADLFGEGITIVGPRIWQLTWKNGIALEWDRYTLTVLRQVPVEGEGWGLCFDGQRLVRSDGSDRLRFHDRTTFAETGSVAVTEAGAPITRINELECLDGQVWANIWQTDRIVRIDPGTGIVTATVDASGLLDPAHAIRADVLNGIAALGRDEFLLGGKLWPTTFRVRFAE